jgi:hypothetical protein
LNVTVMTPVFVVPAAMTGQVADAAARSKPRSLHLLLAPVVAAWVFQVATVLKINHRASTIGSHFSLYGRSDPNLHLARTV